LQKDIVIDKERIETSSLTDFIIECIQDSKGLNIVKLDLRDLEEAPADFFVVCEGTSSTQVSGIAQNVEKKVKDELDIRSSHSEGKLFSNWVLLDYFNVIVHVFYHETRKFYEIEDLWSDAKITEYENI